ncbi:MAG: hypothetical protein JWP97_5323 [Labilithrix sp.]|nr:hypothetical protein [Labilithrix sp.]
MKRPMSIALLFPILMAACAADTEPDEVQTEITNQGVDPAQASKPKTPLCLDGEVLSCTLGPPPVCSCKVKPTAPMPTVVARATAP